MAGEVVGIVVVFDEIAIFHHRYMKVSRGFDAAYDELL